MSRDLACKICYGVDFGEDYSLPWGDDLVGWWISTHGGDAPPTQSYASNRDIWREYYQYKQEFLQRYPVPVDEQYYGYDAGSLALAIPGTCRTDFECVMRFNPKELRVSSEAIEDFRLFFRRHSIELPTEPSWFVLNYYG